MNSVLQGRHTGVCKGAVVMNKKRGSAESEAASSALSSTRVYKE